MIYNYSALGGARIVSDWHCTEYHTVHVCLECGHLMKKVDIVVYEVG